MQVERTWVKVSNTSSNTVSNTTPADPFIFWSMNDEVWEQRNIIFTHFRVLARSMSEGIVKEQIEILPETPVPLEAFGPQIVQGWKVTERKETEKRDQQESFQERKQEKKLVPVAQAKKQMASSKPFVEEMREQSVPASEQAGAQQPQALGPVVPAASSKKDKMASTKKSIVHQSPKSSSNRTGRAQPRQEDQASLGESSSQDSLTPPMELWSNVSLSYFVPENRFYQPSLHLLAKEELSEQPTPTFSDRKSQGNYSQRQQDARPYVRQVQQTTFDRPRTVAQRASEIPRGRPLFV